MEFIDDEKDCSFNEKLHRDTKTDRRVCRANLMFNQIWGYMEQPS